MKGFVRDPLFAFLGIGLALFLVFQQFDASAPAEKGIVVDASTIRYYRAALTQQYRRAPTNAELVDMLHQYIEEEAMYQEALRLGTDKHDPIVRRRLVQTIQFMYQDRGEQQLEETCAAKLPPEALQPLVLADFEQRFFKDGAGITSEALMMKRTPDTLPIGETFNGAAPDNVRLQFGEAVTHAVFELPTNAWHGPLPSAFGTHWVRVKSRKVSGEDPTKKKQWMLGCVLAGRKAQLAQAIGDLIEEHGLTIAKEVTEELPEFSNPMQPAANLQAHTGAP